MYRVEGPEDGGKWPKGPNFLLIVALFGVTIAVCFILALLLIPDFGRHIRMVHPHQPATSRLVLPNLIPVSSSRLAANS
jgi:hypothetical protein